MNFLRMPKWLQNPLARVNNRFDCEMKEDHEKDQQAMKASTAQENKIQGCILLGSVDIPKILGGAQILS